MTSSAEARLTQLGIVLPDPSTPQASYTDCVRVAPLLFVAGKGPGRPADRSEAPSRAHHRARVGPCSHGGPGGARRGREFLGSLDSVEQVVRVQAFVNATEDYAEHHLASTDCPSCSSRSSATTASTRDRCWGPSRCAVGCRSSRSASSRSMSRQGSQEASERTGRGSRPGFSSARRTAVRPNSRSAPGDDGRISATGTSAVSVVTGGSPSRARPVRRRRSTRRHATGSSRFIVAVGCPYSFLGLSTPRFAEDRVDTMRAPSCRAGCPASGVRGRSRRRRRRPRGASRRRSRSRYAAPGMLGGDLHLHHRVLQPHPGVHPDDVAPLPGQSGAPLRRPSGRVVCS